MKRLWLMLCCLLMVYATTHAQQNNKVVTWTVQIKPINEGTEYELIATATMQQGFHIWAMQAGGDGSLIPTSINAGTDVVWKNEWIADKTADAERIEFIDGTVYSYSKSVQFSRRFSVPKNVKKIKGVITYQSCNESMCLPPEDVPFEQVIN